MHIAANKIKLYLHEKRDTFWRADAFHKTHNHAQIMKSLNYERPVLYIRQVNIDRADN